ncbi:short-subunit dehydrogenase [Parasphingopyxis lamellibrachiae]|uniref:Short-subunit dehydrogenase n=2 Tax=Parasphingopyxis lamellibrachiae TaxID=680125 RepID=A0A3D9FFL0_9SPHN|nr:short-subunit dehydrogenase [Parasphingopyxis lamellibrachiae]
MAGKTAVITGAGSGLGKALARLCASQGCNVVIADIDMDHAREVAEGIVADGGAALAVHTDVADRDSVNALAQACYDRFRGCDYLINNAGIAIYKPLVDTSEEDWNRVIGVNLLGIANGISAFMPRMTAAQTSGHIVNIASMAGLLPLEGFGIYVATKFAVVGLSEVLAKELDSTRISVTVACPGWIATAIQPTDPDAPQPSFPPELSRVIAPGEAARIILDAMLAKRLHAPTHPEWRDTVAARSETVVEAFER